MKKGIKAFKKYCIDMYNSHGSNIKVFNSQIYDNRNYIFTRKKCIKQHWLYSFINDRGFNNFKISIWGVNGYKGLHVLDTSKFKLFFTIENVHVFQSPWYKYRDLFINNKHFNLSLGFDYIENEKYLRFPFWIQTQFTPTSKLDDIKNYCLNTESTNGSFNIYKKFFCSFICRLDYFGDRSKFADLISQIGTIHYPGNFRHNDDRLKNEYNDDKIEYLKQFKFNLCPENSNAEGYVTEKIFDAIKAGCIPIYWGSNNCPEPDILNQNRILFLSLDGDNTEVLKKIKILNENETAYNDFYKQPIFTPNAPEVVYGYFERLEKKLREIVE